MSKIFHQKQLKKPQMLLTELSKPATSMTYTYLTLLKWREVEPYTTTIQDAMLSLTENQTGTSGMSYRLQFVESGSLSLWRHNWSSTMGAAFLHSAKGTFANNHTEWLFISL